MHDVKLTNVNAEEYAVILGLNEAAVPHVNSISTATLAHLHAQSSYCKVARIADEIVGFLVVLPETADYDSPNFRYFKGRYGSFAYVDRIFVAEHCRGRGVAAGLYRDLFDEMRGVASRVTCEVNLNPPNPGSIAFHQHMGFRQVDEQDTEGGRKRVSLMVLDLDAEHPVAGA